LAQASSAAPQSAPAKTLAYEVVSIKPAKSYGGWTTTPDGFWTGGISVGDLIPGAYGLVLPNQISGLPAWAGSDLFAIQAKMDEETAAAFRKLAPKEKERQSELMMRALLADRFQLKVHHETKELPVYDLAVAKGGLKMKESPAGQGTNYTVRSGKISGKGVDMQGRRI
jgi:uncharacterized protein (TIGR03435 family)